jgi:prophage tail gpP-like protein
MLSGAVTSPSVQTSNIEDITLVIGGMSFTGWAGLTVMQNVDTCADGFSLSAPFDPTNLKLLSSLRPWTTCYLFIGQDKIITGFLEKFDTHHDGNMRRIIVEGRTITGQLVDCALVPGAQGFGFDNMTLVQIAQSVCTPFGITVSNAYDTSPMSVIIDKSETVFQFLNRIAQGKAVNGVIIPGVTKAIAKISCDGLGRLTVLPPYPSGSPVASLIEGQGPYLGGDSLYDTTRRFSQYRIYVEGEKVLIPLGVSIDPVVSLYRPTARQTGDIFGQDPTLLATYEKGIAYLASTTIAVRVAGWRAPLTPSQDPPAGPVWQKNTLVTLKAPSIRIPTETQFMVCGVTMTMNDEGKTTLLRLTAPGSYVGQMPAVEPWA